MSKLQISIIGTGRVATWLIRNLSALSLIKVGVFGRDLIKTQAISKQYDVNIFETIETVVGDLIIICVNDDAIKSMVEVLNNSSNQMVVHTSGSVGLEVFGTKENVGIWYPLQTFTPSLDQKKWSVPFCITTKFDQVFEVLKLLSTSLNQPYFVLNEDQKMRVHLAAVYTNNFINHLVNQAKTFLENEGIAYEIMVPLLQHTFTKITEKPYDFTQTGPAVRHDLQTIKKHESFLKDQKEMLEIYNIITTSIIQKYHQ